jgi:hypothetical protein
MGIKSGTITEVCQEFYTETLFRHKKISPEYKNICDSILTDGQAPSETLQIKDLGTFEGGWRFWNHLYEPEKERDFNFQPQFCIPSNDLEIPEWILNRYDLVDYKISPRVLFYPFGYFVVRARVFFEFEDEIPVDDFISFEKSLKNELIVSPESGNGSIQDVFKPINDFVFKNTPEYYVGKQGDRKTVRILYLYESERVSKEDRAKIIRRDKRALSDGEIEDVGQPYLGYFKHDEISVDPEGSVITTPNFKSISERNRRWKRIQLMNNIYLAYDFALLERQNLKRIRDNLRSLLDEFNFGSMAGNPIRPRYLVLLQSILDFGTNLRGTRGQAYESLEPMEMKESVGPNLDQYIDRLLKHDSVLRNILQRLPLPLMS